jgi:predicted outer membrane repeat protein
MFFGTGISVSSLLQRNCTMLLSSLRRWMNTRTFSFPRDSQRNTKYDKRRIRLLLEVLEDRWLPSTVMNLNDSGFGSLRQAILDTPAGGTVDFQPGLTGTITLTSDQLVVNNNLTIAGPGASLITVSGGDILRVFSIASNSPATVTISGLTISHGHGTSGGGILNGVGTLTVTDSVVSNNHASSPILTDNSFGGGIENTGTLTIMDSVISNNGVSSPLMGSGLTNGGGIDNTGTLTIMDSVVSNNGVGRAGPRGVSGGGINNTGTLTLINSTVSNNNLQGGFGGAGGGILNVGTLNLINSTVTRNLANAGYRNAGGGIYSSGTLAVLTVTASNFTENSANFVGGGIYITGTGTITDSTIGPNGSNEGAGIFSEGALTIARSSISGNVANSYGGGIYNAGTAHLSITDSSFSDNSTDQEGGGIYNLGTLAVSGSTVSGNSARQSGGGIYNTGHFGEGGLTIVSSSISGNVANNNGGGIYNDSTGHLSITDSSFSDNSTTQSGGGVYNLGTLAVSRGTFSGDSAALEGGSIDSGGTLMIAGSTLSGNSANGGGAIFCEIGATVTISDSTIRDNIASEGGGVFNKGTLTISGCNLFSNSAGTDAGAIRNEGGVVTIDDSTLAGNSSDQGGAIDTIANASLNINGTTFRRNSARIGGAILTSFRTVDNYGTSTFSGNFASQSGGAIYFSSNSALTIAGCTFTANSANENGGAIFGGGTLVIGNSTFAYNSTMGNGGAIRLQFPFAAANIFSTTISANTAQGVGGGIIVNVSPNLFLRNTIIAGNSAPDSPDINGTLTSQGHNLIGDGSGGSGFDPTDLVGTSASPIDPKLGPLVPENGGPTPTMALLPGSPAIDAGDNTNATEFDQRGPGFPRIVHGIIDIGAYEVQVPVVTCSVANSMLWPPNHQLVNVGLIVAATPPTATPQVQVYANDQAVSSDAQNVAPDTLELRADRNGNGDGRVYLIVTTATNSAGSAFNVCSVVVPHSHSPGSISMVRDEALVAENWYRSFQTAPPGFHLIGSEPAGGRGAPSSAPARTSATPGAMFASAQAAPAYSANEASLFGVSQASPSAANLPSIWNGLPWDASTAAIFADDGSMVVRPDAAWRDEVNAAALDLEMHEPWL